MMRSILHRFWSNPLTKRMLRNTSYLFTASTLSAGLSMLQGVLAAQLLGLAAFGILGAITQFASVINKITSFRMSELVVNYIGEFTAEGKNRHAAALFKAAALSEIGSSIVAYGLLLLLAPLGARYIAKDPAMVNLFVLYGLSIFANLIVETATGLLQIYDRFKVIATATMIQSILTLVLITIAFLYRGQLKEVVFAYLLGKGVWAGLISFYALRVAREHWGPGWWRAPLSIISDRRREMLRFAISTNLSGTINLLTRDSDILWLNALTNPIQGGYYKVAKAFMNVLLIPVTPLISTTYREVTREVVKKRWENVRYLLRSGTLLSALWTLPASLGLVLFGPWLVLLYGQEFRPAYLVLLILLIGVIAANLIYWSRSVLLSLGMPEYPTKVGLLAGLLQIGGMLLTVPLWGAPAMAAMLSLFFIVNASVLLWKTLVELRRVSSLQRSDSAGTE